MTLDDLTELGVGDDQIPVDIRRPPDPRNTPDGQQYEMTPYNPFQRNQLQTWDAITMDRMLTIKRPKAKSGEIWISESGFAEVLSLLPLNRVEQKLFWRKYRKIQMIQTGELSAHLVDSRQERLLVELVSQKSRLDVIENGNLNEREMWITNRTLVEQTLRTPSPQQPKGFIGTIASGLLGGGR